MDSGDSIGAADVEKDDDNNSVNLSCSHYKCAPTTRPYTNDADDRRSDSVGAPNRAVQELHQTHAIYIFRKIFRCAEP